MKTTKKIIFLVWGVCGLIGVVQICRYLPEKMSAAKNPTQAEERPSFSLLGSLTTTITTGSRAGPVQLRIPAENVIPGVVAINYHENLDQSRVQQFWGTGLLFEEDGVQTWGVTTTAVLPPQVKELKKITIHVPEPAQVVTPLRVFTFADSDLVLFTIPGAHSNFALAESPPPPGTEVGIVGAAHGPLTNTPVQVSGKVLGSNNLGAEKINTSPPRNGPDCCLAIYIGGSYGYGGAPVIDFQRGQVIGLAYLHNNREVLFALPVSQALVDRLRTQQQ